MSSTPASNITSIILRPVVFFIYIDSMWPATRPMVVGHEGAGIVEKVGPAVHSLVSGDHVILFFQV
ncbi:MAG: alcohol dehydrogenase catalytic domain-containing protein [Dehalococcoidia bacterium]